jgi:hypothetical protein
LGVSYSKSINRVAKISQGNYAQGRLTTDLGWFMVFNATFNNISVILWRSVVLVEETEVTAENHRSDASQWQTLSQNVVSSTPRHERGFNSQ